MRIPILIYPFLKFIPYCRHVPCDTETPRIIKNSRPCKELLKQSDAKPVLLPCIGRIAMQGFSLLIVSVSVKPSAADPSEQNRYSGSARPCYLYMQPMQFRRTDRLYFPVPFGKITRNLGKTPHFRSQYQGEKYGFLGKHIQQTSI